MSRQSSRNRVNGETDLDSRVSEFLDDLGKGMLGLGNSHSIPGHDHDALGELLVEDVVQAAASVAEGVVEGVSSEL